MARKLMRPVKFKSHRLGYFIVILLLLIIGTLILRKDSPQMITDQPVIKNVINKFTLDNFNPVPFKKPGNSASLPSAKWIPQTFNNCVPAGTSMILQYFGHNVSQEETKAHLRTNSDDKNVFIDEVSVYLKNDYAIENKVFFNGDIETIKTLVANGIYVAVEDFLHPNEDIGHFLIIRGFDDTEGVLIADDSYFGVGIKYPYSVWDETQWKPYNREFMPVYKRENEDLVRSIIGESWNEKIMYQNAVSRNQKDADGNPNDMYAWFNVGTSYYGLGEYQKAKTAFEKSQAIGWPHRMLWYQIQPVQTYNKLGEYQKAINTADLGLWLNGNFAEMHYEKAVAYKGLGQKENARLEAQKAIDLDSKFQSARDLINSL